MHRLIPAPRVDKSLGFARNWLHGNAHIEHRIPEGPWLAKVCPGLRFFGTWTSLTDCPAGFSARLSTHTSSAPRTTTLHRRSSPRRLSCPARSLDLESRPAPIRRGSQAPFTPRFRQKTSPHAWGLRLRKVHPMLAFDAWDDVAISSAVRNRHLGLWRLSQLNTQPTASPVNASRLSSRTTAYHSGPRRLAKPYLVGDSHLLIFCQLAWRTPPLAELSCRGSENVASRQLKTG